MNNVGPHDKMLLHLVTNRRRLSGRAADSDRSLECLLLQVRHAIDAGLDAVHIRERDLEASILARVVSNAVALANGTRTRVVVSDRLDVALASGAAGVHLPADAIPARAARAIAPRGFMIGRSVHSVEEATAAGADVDYLIAGTVWPSESKPAGVLLGPTGLAAIVRAVDVPVLAIGGVTHERIADVKACGASGVAAIGLFMGIGEAGGCRAVPLRETAEAVRAQFDSVGRAS